MESILVGKAFVSGRRAMLRTKFSGIIAKEWDICWLVDRGSDWLVQWISGGRVESERIPKRNCEIVQFMS